MRGRLVHTALRFEPRGRALALGRSALAAAQLAVVAGNPAEVLFSPTPGTPGGVRCEGARVMASWCLTGTTGAGGAASRLLALVVLAAVVVGLSPRWTCVPHWYVVISLVAASTTTNGGDRIGQIATMLFIPLCLGDGRRWQWSTSSTPMSPAWRGSAFAAFGVLRLQVFVIYAHAAISKAGDPWWRHGGALHLIAYDPQFGLPPGARDLISDLAGSYWPIAITTWGVIAVQAILAVSVLGGRVPRRFALVLGVGLHVAIAVLMGLLVFGVIMIALLVVVCLSARSTGDGAAGRESLHDGERARGAVRPS